MPSYIRGDDNFDTANVLGQSQTWQAVTRVINTSYQNTTGEPIFICANLSSNMSIEISTNNSTWLKVSGNALDSNNYPISHSLIIQNGIYYRTIRHSGSQGTNIYTWTELR